MLRRYDDRSVLVVDDEQGVRHLMARWLRNGGFDVREAGSAEEALSALEQGPAAVALCDIRMPGHDGLWLAERIRRHYPDSAVVVATALRVIDPAEAGLDEGFVACSGCGRWCGALATGTAPQPMHGAGATT